MAVSRKGDRVDAYVGARIAMRRTALGLSQTTLAERVGISFQQVQKYETGANRISASRLHHLAIVLGAAPADFFPPPPASDGDGEEWAEGLRAMASTRDGRTVTDAFPRIADREVRRSLARIVEALADPG